MRSLLLISFAVLAAIVQYVSAPTPIQNTILAGFYTSNLVSMLDELAAQAREQVKAPAPSTDFPPIHEPPVHGVLPASKNDITHLALLAKYAMAAYYIEQIQSWTCELCQKPSLRSTKPHYVHHDKTTGLKYYVAVNDEQKSIYVAFAGTDSKQNVLTDIDSFQKPLFNKDPKEGFVLGRQPDGWKKTDLSKANVHRGFLKLYLTGREPMMNKVLELHKNPKYAKYTIRVTGHSLGGALSTLASLDIARTIDNGAVTATTFASPRVGNSVFAELYRKVGNLYQSRFVFAADIVPHLPPDVFGFVHVGQEFWFPVTKDAGVLKCRIQADYTEDPEGCNHIWPVPSPQMHSSVIGYNKPPVERR